MEESLNDTGKLARELEKNKIKIKWEPFCKPSYMGTSQCVKDFNIFTQTTKMLEETIWDGFYHTQVTHNSE